MPKQEAVFSFLRKQSFGTFIRTHVCPKIKLAKQAIKFLHSTYPTTINDAQNRMRLPSIRCAGIHSQYMENICKLKLLPL